MGQISKIPFVSYTAARDVGHNTVIMTANTKVRHRSGGRQIAAMMPKAC
jgi:hypothetical protein